MVKRSILLYFQPQFKKLICKSMAKQIQTKLFDEEDLSMGKQYNAREKRIRRKSYLKRLRKKIQKEVAVKKAK